MADFDVVVIGAGPGGYVSAIRSAQRGAKTVVVEKKYLGGVCLNIGCIPTKTLINTANLFRKIKKGSEFGIKIENPQLDLQQLKQRKDKVIALNTGGIERLFKSYNIEWIKGEAEINQPNEVNVDGKKITTKNIIIATGGRPVELPILPFDKERVIDSSQALELAKIPGRIGIIGAGAIGCEFACIWNTFGAEVHLIEMLPHILPKEDEELTKRLESIFKKEGIQIYTGSKLKEAKVNKNSVTLSIEGNKTSQIEVDMVLVCVGMRCNSEYIKEPLRSALKINKRGGIGVNEKMETGIPGIYAIGDVIDRTWLAHGASNEGIVAAINATGGNKRINYNVLPACTFTFPELASVGKNESKVKEQGAPYKVGRFLFAGNGRAHTLGEPEGMVKIIGDNRTDEILGVHILGPEAGEIIATASVAMTLESTVEELVETIFTHPTLSEALMEASEDYYGMSIHTPPKKA
ncbi:MAG TPA: dihydrolipoyl dehydrogenase [Candidatus Hydrogenedens sp.]|nr:dihydrolipoyl dehydrogenase [Candidatus Hydrogenedens sp.]